MDLEPIQTKTFQPALFNLGENSSGTVELFPAVWSAAEAVTNPNPSTRLEGVKKLESLGAHRLSPLIAYLLATRLMDSDIHLRTKVARLLASVLVSDENGNYAPLEVRHHLKGYLLQMRTRMVYALLEVVVWEPASEADVTRLISLSSFAGGHLVDILMERKPPLEIRRAAAKMIGSLGYIDALPAVERLFNRLEARQSGQQAMPFAPVDEKDETVLLTDVAATITLLREP